MRVMVFAKATEDSEESIPPMGFGEGASPALAGDTLVVNWDHEGESFIVEVDGQPPPAR